MNTKKTILLFLILLLVALLFSTLFKDNFKSKIRIINDPQDRNIYAQRGSWFTLNKIPYTEVPSEYPQIATYFFAIPHVLRSLVPTQYQTTIDYSTIFSLLMMFFSVGSIWLLFKLLKKQKNLAFLLLLPASFYFTYNRFDIIPCFLTLLSLYFLSKKRFNLSIFVLTIGILTKWYLILLLPIFLVYYHTLYKKINWYMITIIALTGLIIILPTIITGGINALIMPYKFHLQRIANSESIIFFISSPLKNLNLHNAHDVVLLLSFLMQFITIPFVLISKIDSFEKVIKWSTLSILIFIFFAKFYSPQWILWITPLLILNIKKKTDIIYIVLFDLITYIYFPLLFFTLGPVANVFLFVVLIKSALLLKFIMPLWRELINNNSNPQINSNASNANI